MQQSITAFLALSVLALGAPTAHISTKVPLPRRRSMTRSTGQVDYQTFFSSLNHTLQKYSGKSIKTYPALSDSSLLGNVLKRQSNEALTDEYEDGVDELYYGSGTVGSGTQVFTFDFDTGSSDTFIPGPDCGTSQGCVGTTKYAQTGIDEGNTTSVTYGSGSIEGENYFDSVTIAGLQATHQNIISLTTATGFSDSAADGLMGMGFQSIANSGQPPYFLTLINEGKVSNPEFSFYLGRGQDGTGGNSEMTLGGSDSSKYTGTISAPIPVTTAGYWQIAVDSVTANGILDPADGLLTAGQAAIDTGTTLVLAPTIAATSIFARIPGSIPVPIELIDGSLEPILYLYPCSSSPDVAISFGGTDYAINAEDFNFGSVTGDFGTIVGNNTLASLLDLAEYCLAGIAADDIQPTENLYVVGDVFIKNWYSIFSYTGASGQPSVSFAKSV